MNPRKLPRVTPITPRPVSGNYIDRGMAGFVRVSPIITTVFALATTVLIATTAPAANVSVLRGETVRCDATASEGHPVAYEWQVTDPEGQPVPIEPGTAGILDLVMDTSGLWQIGVDAHYAHTVETEAWVSRFDGTIEVTSVIASLTTIPEGGPLQIPISSGFTLDGTASRFGDGTDIQATWSFSDGGAWYTLSECGAASGSVTDPAELSCAVSASSLGAGEWTVRMELEDATSSQTDAAEVEVVVTDIQFDYTWTPPHPDAGQDVSLTVILTGGSPAADIEQITWTFGDGDVYIDNCAFSQCRGLYHTYAVSGIYSLAAEVVLHGGETQSAAHDIIVGTPPEAPTAAFSVDLDQTEAPAQATLTFTGSCEAPCSYTWFFGDGGSTSGSGSTPPTQIHTYTDPGDYTIRLEVSNTTADDADEQVVSLTAPQPVEVIFADDFESGTSNWSGTFNGS
jgi:hypothetical protein